MPARHESARTGSMKNADIGSTPMENDPIGMFQGIRSVRFSPRTSTPTAERSPRMDPAINPVRAIPVERRSLR